MFKKNYYSKTRKTKYLGGLTMALLYQIDSKSLKGDAAEIGVVREILKEINDVSVERLKGHYEVSSTGEVRINLYNSNGTAPEVYINPPTRTKLYRHSSGLILLGKAKDETHYQIDFGVKNDKIKKITLDENVMVPLTDILDKGAFDCSADEVIQHLALTKRVLGEYFRIDQKRGARLTSSYEVDRDVVYFEFSNRNGKIPLIENIHYNGCQFGVLIHKPNERLVVQKRKMRFPGGSGLEIQLLFKDQN
jgi:hypothetical protein